MPRPHAAHSHRWGRPRVAGRQCVGGRAGVGRFWVAGRRCERAPAAVSTCFPVPSPPSPQARRDAQLLSQRSQQLTGDAEKKMAVS